METLSGLEDKMKQSWVQVNQDETVQEAVRLFKQSKAESAQQQPQVQQQLSLVNFASPHLSPPSPLPLRRPFVCPCGLGCSVVGGNRRGSRLLYE